MILGEGFSSFGFVDFSGTNRPYHPKMGIPHPEPTTCFTEGLGVVGGEWSRQERVLLAATLCPLFSSTPCLQTGHERIQLALALELSSVVKLL